MNMFMLGTIWKKKPLITCVADSYVKYQTSAYRLFHLLQNIESGQMCRKKCHLCSSRASACWMSSWQFCNVRSHRICSQIHYTKQQVTQRFQINILCLFDVLRVCNLSDNKNCMANNKYILDNRFKKYSMLSHLFTELLFTRKGPNSYSRIS